MKVTVTGIKESKSIYSRHTSDHVEALVKIDTDDFEGVCCRVYRELITLGFSHPNEMFHGPDDTESGKCEIVVMRYKHNLASKAKWMKDVRNAVIEIVNGSGKHRVSLSQEQIDYLHEKVIFGETRESWYDKSIRESIRRNLDNYVSEE